jgi:predicted alpha/beta superfamily hydrolase
MLTLPLIPVDGPVPLLVILDGDTMIHTATETARTITVSTMGALGQAAFVGIMRDVPLGLEYMSTRFEDFTPTEWTLPGPFAADNATVQHGTGRAGALLDTIIDGILPQVSRIVQVDENRTGVCGWSLSGLFAAHAWMTRPDVFSDLVAISPSLWWDDASILASPFSPRPRPAKVLVTAGQHEEGDISRVWPQGYFNVGNRDTIAQQRELAAMVRNARTFGAMASAAGADTRTVVFDDEHHVTLVPASISRALIHLYG